MYSHIELKMNLILLFFFEDFLIIKQNNLKGETFQIYFSGLEAQARGKDFLFSFAAFRRVGIIWDHFDISAVKRGLRSNFWDYSELSQSTNFGIINPNRPIFINFFFVYTTYREKVIFEQCWHFKTKGDIELQSQTFETKNLFFR